MNTNKISSFVLAWVLKNKYNADVIECNVNEEQFYCDFYIDDKILSIKDFPRIKKEMQKLICNKENIEVLCNLNNSNLGIEVNEFTKQLINDSKKDTTCFVKVKNDYFFNANFDLSNNNILCSNEIKDFELDNLGGIYFKNDAKNKQLTRIYGYAFDNSESMELYKAVLLDRKERDHRKIGSDLELFTFNLLAGQGLPIWLGKGTVVKKQIENFIYELLTYYDFEFVQTPVLGNVELYKTSGHWNHYRSSMFTPISIEDEELVLRPMTCPHHLLVYKHKPKSYRELPYRVAEHAILHRYEASGALTGFERVRSMQLVDTHIVVRPDQIVDEIKRLYELIKKCHTAFNIKAHRVDLSLHDANDEEKFFNNPEMWGNAESQLEKALGQLQIDYERMEGEAAFYGPKIDFQVKSALGHIITVSTVQLDFLLPERFGLEYIDKDGKLARPILIHCSVIGTFERFFSILLEKTKGALPLWLAPTQVAIMPVIEKHDERSGELHKLFKDNKIRSEIYNSSNRIAKRIRDAQIKKVPYQIVVGDDELENNSISYRTYGSEDVIKTTPEKFVQLLKQQIDNKN